MPAAVKSLRSDFEDAVAKFKADIEADGVSAVTVMATPGKSEGEIAFTDTVGGLATLPSLNALLSAAQAWDAAAGLTLVVIHRKGSVENTLIDTRRS